MEEIKMMKKFKDLTDDKEAFDAFVEMQHQDDEKLKEYFSQCSHKEFNFALLNIGTLLNTIATYFRFVQNQVDDTLKLQDKVKNRKMNKILKDLNEKINDRYDFDEDTRIIKGIVLYYNELYLYIEKCDFIKKLQLEDINW